MGALIGLGFGYGVLLAWRSGSRAPRARLHAARSLHRRVADLLVRAGYDGVGPGQLAALCGTLGVGCFVVVAGLTRSIAVAVAFAGFAAWFPVGMVRRRCRQRSVELREVWPDAVDNLASAIRAGMSLPEALGQLASRGPEPLRAAFERFAADYRATGRFGDCLERLKGTLADPTGDRIVEALRVAREVGGTDIGRLLRTLSQFLRDDARTRAELETRQGWTVNAARLALAAPWVVLAMLSLRPQTVAAFDSSAGVMVLAGGAGVSVAAYRIMVRLAALPAERRVLR